MNIKTILAFATAPFVIPLVFVACDVLAPNLLSAGAPLPLHYRLTEGIRIGFIAMGVGYVVMLAGAVPMHFSFVRRRWVSWWMYALLGVFLGTIPWLFYALMLLWGLGPGSSYPIHALGILIGLGAACGTLAATVFWLMAVKQ
jgi:hypothetical protein